VASQQLCAVVLLDQFENRRPHASGKLQRGQTTPGHDLVDEIRHSGRRIVASEEVGRTHGGDQLGQAIGDEVVLLGALLSDDRFDKHAKLGLITATFGLDEVDQQIRTCHVNLPSPIDSLYGGVPHGCDTHPTRVTRGITTPGPDVSHPRALSWGPVGARRAYRLLTSTRSGNVKGPSRLPGKGP
jgi:hypothetical protein